LCAEQKKIELTYFSNIVVVVVKERKSENKRD
jgi:hypothetical protein